MQKQWLTSVPIFLAVAKHESFSKAGIELETSTSAISQAIRQMEDRLGLPLFYRTTRSVALTEAGQALHRRLAPANTEMEQAFDEVRAFSEAPRGTLRLNIPTMAVRNIIEPVVVPFLQTYPDVALDIGVENRNVDIIAEGYDAGIRLGESVEPDMVSVSLYGTINSVILGAPDYLRKRGMPKTIEDLKKHNCIQFRHGPNGPIYRWHMTVEGEEVQIDTTGNLIVADAAIALDAASKGLGLCYYFDFLATPYLESGKLVSVMNDFKVPEEGPCIYFPRRAQQSQKLRVFIDFLKKNSQLLRRPRFA